MDKEAEQKPVGWAKFTEDCIAVSDKPFDSAVPLYTTPQKAEKEPVLVGTMEVFSGWGDEANFEQLPFDLPDGCYKLYTAPPQKPWVSLSDDEINKISHAIANAMPSGMTIEDWKRSFARTIESKLKEKNS